MANNVEQNSFMETEKASELYKKFQTLKPLHSSADEGLRSSIFELENLASQHGKTIEKLLLEAHTTPNTQAHHVQALSLERVIARLR